MKKITKLLALVLAGLLCVSTLLACTGNIISSTDDDDEDEEKMDFSEYKGLTPEEVWEKLTDAENVKISMENFDGGKSTITRSGDKAKLSPNSAITYYDYKNNIHYIPNQDGSYSKESLIDGWEDLLEQEVAGFFESQSLDFFLEEDWYEKSGSIYSATADTLDNVDLECDSISAYMEVTKTTYTFVCEMEQDGDEKTAICEVDFDEFTVKLPEVEGDNADNTTNGGAVEKPLPNTTTKPATTESKPVTDSKPVTTPPVTEAPAIPDDAMTPGQVYTSLGSATDATLILKYKVDGVSYHYEFTKDGDIFEWKETNDNLDGYLYYYYDNANNRQYYYAEDGNWYYITDSLDWSSLLNDINGVLEGVLAMDDSRFEYDADQDRVMLSDEYCEQLNVRSVGVKKSGEQYILTIVYNDFSTSTFSVKFNVFSAVRLPSNAQPAPETPEPPVTSEPTTYYAPSELYNAIINSEDVYFEVFNGSQYAIYQKDGHIVSTSVGNTKDNMTTVYVDTENGIGYIYQNGQWQSGPYTQTWKEMMTQASITPTTYLFVDSYFSEFDADDTKLTIKPELLSNPNAVIELIRDGETYTYNISDGTTSTYFYISFESLTVDLPA